MNSKRFQLLLCCALAISVLHRSIEATASETDSPSLDAVKQTLQSGSAPVRIVCFGDSITGVYYHTGSRRAWCDMLGLSVQKAYPKAKIEMVNAGISGHTTVNALARIESDVLDRKPQLVVVKFGMNDVTRVKIDDFERNMNSIVEQCQAAGAAVVLCTPNSVIENGARPNAKLKEFSSRVRKVAVAHKLLLVDLFSAWQEIRKEDALAWRLLMSDAIHPNMNGHKRFAELIASRIADRKIVLGPIEPPHDGLWNTFNRLKAGQPVKLIAMPPYDQLLQDALKKHFPDASFEVTSWPVADQTVADLHVWSKQIRGASPNLVVVAIPAAADDKTESAYINNYEWALNYSFHFGKRVWDVVPVLPDVTQSVKESEAKRFELAKRLIIGKDVEFIARDKGDKRPAADIVDEWVTQRLKTWKSKAGS